jgi:glycosyltransferase involved in cell wall biosynthesis
VALKLSKQNPKKVLAPRGMLGKGALEIKKAKKMTFIKASKFLGLYKNMLWHASTELEEKEIQAVFGKKAEVKIAQNIATLPKLIPTKVEKQKGAVNFFFLSRIAQKKNLLGMLKILKNTSGKIRFDIIGPADEADYWLECEKVITESKHIEINYLGAIPFYNLPEKLSEYHFMLLFTQNENYGHAIIESLANRCPVLISDQTPWRNLQQKNIGWDISIEDEQGFAKAIEEARDMDSEQYNEMAEASRQFVIDEVMDARVIEQNKGLFE